MNPAPANDFAAQLWADVGGTFTDCFLVSGQSRRSIKVLSSGVVRAELASIESAHRMRLRDAATWPTQFWDGATVRFLIDGTRVHETTLLSCPSGVAWSLREPLPISILGGEIAGGNIASIGVELDARLEAPVVAAHRLLGIPIADPLPRLDIRLGTTRGTNALLTRTGATVGLVTTLGFADCLDIGEQTRPDLFALHIVKPKSLTGHVIEVDERITATGDVITPIRTEGLRHSLQTWRDSGIDSVAICLLHSPVNPAHELIVAGIAAEVGFHNISVSSVVAPMIKLVARAETTVLDAYLAPVLTNYLSRLKDQFNRRGAEQPTVAPESRLRMMTSGGNLIDAAFFGGAESILSGPAGGVVALGKLADAMASSTGAIGLDMGGTSTDVCRYDGKVPRSYESFKAGVRVLVPMIGIHTIAAGGGSICDVVDGRLVVGPGSAGAMPGPAAYGNGGPLTVTDLNVILGRLPADRFPFALDIDPAVRRIEEVNARLGEHAFKNAWLAAEGFWKLAITQMAEAVRTVSIAQGSDPRNMPLVGFGGAAGGHVCGVADAIGMTRIIDHVDASLLSALGMGLADVGRIRTVNVQSPLDGITASQWTEMREQTRLATLQALASEWDGDDGDRDRVRTTFEADVRYEGTEATLPIDAMPFETIAQRFQDAHRNAFGYHQQTRRVHIAAMRCEAYVPSLSSLRVNGADASPSQAPSPTTTMMSVGGRREPVPMWDRANLAIENRIHGPAIIASPNSTLVVDRGWSATKLNDGTIELVRANECQAEKPTVAPGCSSVDAVTVEVVARRMQGIADAMGEVLRRTAASVNIRQRLDYSCAIFTGDGSLVANAPHVPVHLGAMGHTVRAIIDRFGPMSDGDVYVTNDPYAGGSHLPDVTVVTPVFCGPQNGPGPSPPDFFVASRAHHAEIGGKTPGSMPPDARCLAEEGVVIEPFALRRSGHDASDDLLRLLRGGPYPSRDPETNMADIGAARAAGQMGAQDVRALVSSIGLATVNQCVRTLFEMADQCVTKWLATQPMQTRSFRDCLDDGTVVEVAIRRARDRLEIDFSGTAPVHPGCFNATPAIVTSATIYVLRCVIGGTLPMNDGILRHVDLRIPAGLLNPPRGQTPSESPAVVAGNVETSMRVVDCLLGALQTVAASQGTMNNVLIGDEGFGYYETIGGGSGAGPGGDGASGVHVHMTNTRITDPEIYESRYPVRLWRFAIRRGSGGAGRHRGGDGLIREIEFLRPLAVSLITNRRGRHRPWGLQGGGDGSAGENWLQSAGGEMILLDSSATLSVKTGDRLVIMTPGGGGFGDAVKAQ